MVSVKWFNLLFCIRLCLIIMEFYKSWFLGNAVEGFLVSYFSHSFYLIFNISYQRLEKKIVLMCICLNSASYA